jgi:two-component system response regulator FimZ (fimbrial Z protein)
MRIILADHHTEPRWALKTLLDELPEFDLVGEAVDSQGLLMLAKEHTADLVVADAELPGDSIEELIDSLHALEPRPMVIITSGEFESGRMLLRAGADAFVSKADEPDWLLEKLHQYAKQINRKEEANRNNKS